MLIFERRVQMRKFVIFHIVIGLVFTLLVSGCSITVTDAPPSNTPKVEHPFEENKKQEKASTKHPEPLQIQNGSFEKVYGWLDNETILYSYINEGKYVLESDQLYSKHHEVIFTSEAPIMNVLIHKHSKKLFIHTSPYSHSANVYFTDFKGNIEFSTEIDSYELVYEWNETDPSLMLVTAFFEDWSYKVHLINVNTGKVEEVEDVQPFLKWYNDKQILEQDWKVDDLAFFAPVLKKSLYETTDPVKVFEDVFRFDIFANNIMTIKVEEDNIEALKYTFFDLQQQKIFDITLPNITQYSDWLIPYYTFNEKSKTFLTFAPKKHDSIELYNEDYELISVDLNEHKKTVLFNNIENKPILCSKEGDLCLYGYQYEQLLDLNTGKILPLTNS
ncbi:hypothetical protein KHA93_08345 [Bacillus sp. FJAT-49732]|uniref:YqgU-like 6-bladed beta-propeller domain-containing protein n=1 Tax=Lederbergia citrisecunda TaxID=2833583 RepID=A0A942TPP5_9BACI|nr:hypothetical protein [Lederbergia citrisecunda]MBS4199664.1 hypothetical protein [Lederbergia citrisecunda]